jgi:hypothetical protein
MNKILHTLDGDAAILSIYDRVTVKQTKELIAEFGTEKEPFTLSKSNNVHYSLLRQSISFLRRTRQQVTDGHTSAIIALCQQHITRLDFLLHYVAARLHALRRVGIRAKSATKSPDAITISV